MCTWFAEIQHIYILCRVFPLAVSQLLNAYIRGFPHALFTFLCILSTSYHRLLMYLLHSSTCVRGPNIHYKYILSSVKWMKCGKEKGCRFAPQMFCFPIKPELVPYPLLHLVSPRTAGSRPGPGWWVSSNYRPFLCHDRAAAFTGTALCSHPAHEPRRSRGSAFQFICLGSVGFSSSKWGLAVLGLW